MKAKLTVGAQVFHVEGSPVVLEVNDAEVFRGADKPVEPEYPPVDYSRLTQHPRPDLDDDAHYRWTYLWLYNPLPAGWSWDEYRRITGRKGPPKPDAPDTPPIDRSGFDLSDLKERRNAHAANVPRRYRFAPATGGNYRITFAQVPGAGYFETLKWKPAASSTWNTVTPSGMVKAWDYTSFVPAGGVEFDIQTDHDGLFSARVDRA